MHNGPKTHVYKVTLRNVYGLTDAMIAELGEPDMLVNNPHWRSGPKSSLYLIERVEAWCDRNADRLAQARAQRAARSSRMSDIAQRRRAELLQWASEVKIKVEAIPANLMDRAESWYAWRAYERGHGDNPEDIDGRRIGAGALIAYVRHQYTNYEALLADLESRPGCVDAYPIIKERVNGAVSLALQMLGLLSACDQIAVPGDGDGIGVGTGLGEDVRMQAIGAPALPGMVV